MNQEINLDAEHETIKQLVQCFTISMMVFNRLNLENSLMFAKSLCNTFYKQKNCKKCGQNHKKLLEMFFDPFYYIAKKNPRANIKLTKGSIGFSTLAWIFFRDSQYALSPKKSYSSDEKETQEIELNTIQRIVSLIRLELNEIVLETCLHHGVIYEKPFMPQISMESLGNIGFDDVARIGKKS